jgi:uncharacterized membrane protein YqjE
MTDSTQRAEPWSASLRKIYALTLSLLVTRGELASLELAEARDRCVRWLVFAVIAVVLLLAALLSLSLWVAAIFWDGPRGLAIGMLTAVYAAAAYGMLRAVRREIAAAPPLLAQTRAELQKDRAALRGRLAESGDDSG